MCSEDSISSFVEVVLVTGIEISVFGVSPVAGSVIVVVTDSLGTEDGISTVLVGLVASVVSVDSSIESVTTVGEVTVSDGSVAITELLLSSIGSVTIIDSVVFIVGSASTGLESSVSHIYEKALSPKN